VINRLINCFFAFSGFAVMVSLGLITKAEVVPTRSLIYSAITPPFSIVKTAKKVSQTQPMFRIIQGGKYSFIDRTDAIVISP